MGCNDIHKVNAKVHLRRGELNLTEHLCVYLDSCKNGLGCEWEDMALCLFPDKTREKRQQSLSGFFILFLFSNARNDKAPLVRYRINAQWSCTLPLFSVKPLSVKSSLQLKIGKRALQHCP